MEKHGFFIVEKGDQKVKSTDMEPKVLRKRGHKDKCCQTGDLEFQQFILMAVQVIPKALSQGLGKLGGRSKQKMLIKMEVKEEPKLEATQDSTAITHKHKLQMS